MRRAVRELAKKPIFRSEGGNFLRVVQVDELPRRHQVMVHVKEPDLFAEEALRLLGRQNAGLATGDCLNMTVSTVSITQINLHHSKGASAILARSTAAMHTHFAIIQEP